MGRVFLQHPTMAFRLRSAGRAGLAAALGPARVEQSMLGAACIRSRARRISEADAVRRKPDIRAWTHRSLSVTRTARQMPARKLRAIWS